jgi:hypothetical protein
VLVEAVASPAERLENRIARTVALLERRGYALAPGRLGSVCAGGPLAEPAVQAAVAGHPELEIEHGMVVRRGSRCALPSAERARAHGADSAAYLRETIRFVRALARLNPYILAVSIAGSLASGGFRDSDDVDLNLVVEDGRRHLAYVAVNLLGMAHALRHRRKPVDTHSVRPLAPRLMTANLILERSQCFPLERQDEDMAYELLAAEPVHGLALWREVVAANPALLEHFPQLDRRPAPWAVDIAAALPGWLYPRVLDRPSRRLGGAAWRYMQWTRRKRPEALARVAYVRDTMRPYTLFDGPP